MSALFLFHFLSNLVEEYLQQPATEQQHSFNSAHTLVTVERCVRAAARLLIHSYLLPAAVIVFQTAYF